jgi:hypothetical protein
MINDPDILADIARYHRVEMIAAADEFRRAKQSRRRHKPSRKLRRPVIRADRVPSQSGPASASRMESCVLSSIQDTD